MYYRKRGGTLNNSKQTQKRIEELENELEKVTLSFKQEKNRLIELIASWKRKAEGRGVRRDSLREGYNANTGMHYKIFEIELPGDLPIEKVLDYLKENELPKLYPYTFRKIDYVPKRKIWIFEVEFNLQYNIQLEKEFLRKYYENK